MLTGNGGRALPPRDQSSTVRRQSSPRPRTSLGLAHLLRREGTPRQAKLAEAKFDLDEAVPPDARARGERQVVKLDLEMRHLQPFAAMGDFASRDDRG